MLDGFFQASQVLKTHIQTPGRLVCLRISDHIPPFNISLINTRNIDCYPIAWADFLYFLAVVL